MSVRGLAGAFWAAFVVAAGLYAAMAAWSLPLIAREAGGAAPFDLRPLGYGPEEAAAFLSALSDRGRAFYLGTQHRLDALYPPAMGLAFALGFAALFRGGLRAALVALAVGVALFDLLENRAVSALLRGDPAAPDPALVAAASRWTLLKSAATTAAWAALLAGGARALARRRRAPG